MCTRLDQAVGECASVQHRGDWSCKHGKDSSEQFCKSLDVLCGLCIRPAQQCPRLLTAKRLLVADGDSGTSRRSRRTELLPAQRPVVWDRIGYSALRFCASPRLHKVVTAPTFSLNKPSVNATQTAIKLFLPAAAPPKLVWYLLLAYFSSGHLFSRHLLTTVFRLLRTDSHTQSQTYALPIYFCIMCAALQEQAEGMQPYSLPRAPLRRCIPRYPRQLPVPDGS